MGYIGKNLVSLAALMAFSTTSFAIGRTLDAGKLGLKDSCPALVQADLEAIARDGHTTLKDTKGKEVKLETTMKIEDFKKQIPGKMYVISKGKTFEALPPTFTQESDGRVLVSCTYQWKSALAGITKNEHVFTAAYYSGDIVTGLTISNQNSKDITVGIFKEGKEESFFPGVTVKSKAVEKVDFLQKHIDSSPSNASIKFLVNGKLVSGSESVADCKGLLTGKNYEINFVSQLVGTRCEAKEVK